MYKCEICKRDFKNIRALSMHIVRSESLSKEEYYNKYLKIDMNEDICIICGKKTKFCGLNNGYNKYCSYKCSANSPQTINKRKETCRKRYGVENVSQSEEVKQQYKNTINVKYGVDHYSKTQQYKDKYKETCLDKFGVENPLQSAEIRKKIKRTNLERYGVEHPSQSEEIKEKKKETCLKNFGVEHPFQSAIIRDKSKSTCLFKYNVSHPMKLSVIQHKLMKICLDKYGVEYPIQSEEIKEKMKQTMLKRYGVENAFQSEEVKEKKKETCLEKYGFEYSSQSVEVKEKILENKRISFFNRLLTSDRLKEKCTPNFTIDEFKGATYIYSWICTTCKKEIIGHLHDGQIPRCYNCYPKLLGGPSKPEKEVAEFVESLGIQIESNSRQVIPPLELDIYIPSHNLAIEFDGLYWHSEIGGHKDKTYHITKTLNCLEKGIQLIHIFEDEWIDKQEIVKSMLRAKLGVTPTKVYARKCTIQSVPSNDAQLFLFDNHLQGSINGKHLGLYYENDLVALLTYAKPRFNKKYDYEIFRFCNKINTSVVGGLSKLIAQLKRLSPDKTIISYADRRYGEGNGYLQCGFTIVNSSGPSFFYIKDFRRQNRMRFQKHLLEDKLEVFDPILTEWENMQLNDYDRIWDCGCNVYVTEQFQRLK